MPVESSALWNILGPFVLTLARIGGLFAFLPLPGWRTAPDLARMLVVLALTLSLTPLRTAMAPPSGAAALVLWLLGEAAFGLFVGLIVSFVSEGLLLAIQAISLQAGYSFATTFDPNSQADSGVLQTFLTIGTNLLFFLTGLHHTAIRAFASSLEKWPGGSIPAQGLGAGRCRLRIRGLPFGSPPCSSGCRIPPVRRPVSGAGGKAAGSTSTAVHRFPCKDARRAGVIDGADARDGVPVSGDECESSAPVGGGPPLGASSMAGRDQRTEKPTPQKLRKAREEGRFPVSREFVAGVQFCCFAAIVVWTAGSWWPRAGSLMRRSLLEAFRPGEPWAAIQQALGWLRPRSCSPLD